VHDEDTPSKKIRVVDRRWFTEDGELRPEREVPSPAPRETPPDSQERTPPEPSGTPETERPRAPGDRPPAGSRPETEAPQEMGQAGLDFLSLVDFLAQQALVLLSGAHGVEKNRDQARIFIDFLGVLEEKTRGNLSPEEARILTDVLFQLRTLFVQAAP